MTQKNKLYLTILAFLLALLILVSTARSQSPAVIELNADGSWNWVVTLTPHIITTTPSASQTPWIVTSTPDTFLTPTPTEEILPTATPMPELCYGITTVNLSYRIKPSTSATRLGTWQQGTLLQLDEYVFVGNDEWAFVHDPSNPTERGWSAAFFSGIEYIDLEDTQSCLEIKFKEPPTALLWHTVPGFNISNAQNSYEILRNKPVGFGLKPYASLDACIDVLERGGICIYRHGSPDCPQHIGSADPRQSARDFLIYGQGAQRYLAHYEQAYYEPVNECRYGEENHPEIYEWWAEWLDEYITLAYARGYPKLVIPTLGPGHGDELMFSIWKNVLELNASHGGLFGEHAYTPFHDKGLCECDEWLACRHRTNEITRQAIGLDIDVAITEAARGWGNDPVSVHDFTCWYGKIQDDAWVHSVSLWTAGYHPTWPLANLDNYMVPIAQGIN